MSSNRDLLLAQLHNMPLFAGRYRELQCVNYDPANKEKRGCFSLVFRATDVVTGRVVALKFFDIDFSVLQNPYRIQAFEREPEILKVLLGKHRCLQLAAGLDTFQLEIRSADGTISARLPCKYFAVEWIDEEIDKFFHRQDEFGPEEKLRLFNEIVLGVQALHRHDVFHRDLKPDNLRAYIDALKRIVIAIDLGTAARVISIPLQPEYGHPVGAGAYAAPENFCGMAGLREVGKATDVFALGCLLFELFHTELFAIEVRKNRSYDLVLAAMAIDLATAPRDKLVAAWRRSAPILERSLRPVKLDGIGSSAPPAIRGILNQIIAVTTRFDFVSRTENLDAVREQVWAAIRVLTNDKVARRRAEITRLHRQRREEKIRRQQRRLIEFLGQAQLRQCSTPSPLPPTRSLK